MEEQNRNFRSLIKRLEERIMKENRKKGGVKEKSKTEISEEKISEDFHLTGCREKGYSFRTSTVSTKIRTTPSTTLMSQSFLESSRSIVAYKEKTIKIKTPCYMKDDGVICENLGKICDKSKRKN